MATVDSLKQALRQEVKDVESSLRQPLSDTQYSAGFDIFIQALKRTTYRDFIIPQLSQLVAPLFDSRIHISVLEIGPGPKSVLGYLPDHLRQKIRRYTAFEPNSLFAESLQEWFTSETGHPLQYLENPPNIRRTPFTPEDETPNGTDTSMGSGDEKYDLVLFCHSMYGMKPKRRTIEQALTMLVEGSESGVVVVFHRDGSLHLDGLVCHRTASYPNGVICVADDDKVLDLFAPFVADFLTEAMNGGNTIRADWHKVCRALAYREKSRPNQLQFGLPDVMVAFTQRATTLTELTAQMPSVKRHTTIKNREARLRSPASIMRPNEVRDVQQCVLWALKHRVGLTVIGGGHSGHCLWDNVVAIDMSAFDQIHLLEEEEDRVNSGLDSRFLVVVETGCKTGDIVRRTMAVGVTVPLGARPSVGAGLWLQGGIGHLARLHGLACDAIVGAVVVSVDSGQVLCVGHVPSQHWPAGAIRPEPESDLLWALQGAGTNFGIVISVTFKAYAAPSYVVRDWDMPLSDNLEAQLRLSDFDRVVAANLPRNYSADAYLYWDDDQLHLGVTMLEFTATPTFTTVTPSLVDQLFGPEKDFKTVDGVGLFATDMYVSSMHGGHGGGKTSSFKRCIFLKRIGDKKIAGRLVAAVETRPSRLCYLHLLQGGGAVSDVAADATAFGCRDWDFACVITGVWPRDQDGTEVARSAIQWVYSVAGDLLPLSRGAYGADLGPDPRDAELAAKAFGPNGARLARIKGSLDPHCVLAYTCPLPRAPVRQQLVVLVTGESCAGKDFCAAAWVSFLQRTRKNLTARAVSISDATKREYAAATGADVSRLLSDRAYKEHHRPALTTFFQKQVREQPQLPEQHFLDTVNCNVDVDVLVITGIRDEVPIATFSHLVPNSRLIDVHVQATEHMRRIRRGCHGRGVDNGSDNGRWSSTVLDYRPSLIFDNDVTGIQAAYTFAEQRLLPFLHEDLQRLAHMVRSVPNFPREGIEFRHVLNIAQQEGGLDLCTSLLESHFTGDWKKVDRVACCEAGGFIYASALALQVHVPLVLIREAGKLPPPIISVGKSSSYISSLFPDDTQAKRIEMERDAIPRGASVVVVDDVLSTGKTLCAVLQLLSEAGIGAEDISVVVVAEFPMHRGRELLRRCGYSKINIQSLLVFGGT